LQPPHEPGAGVGDGVDRLELRNEAAITVPPQGIAHPVKVAPLVSGHRGSSLTLAFARSRRYACHPMQGTLQEGVLPLVLRTVYVERKTGPLHVTRGAERASVCFTQGNIVYGQSNIKECRLGETLVRHALLTEWDLERARDVMKVTGRRLGEVLLDLGILDASGLEDALAIHVREVLMTIFSWREGSYRFEDQDVSFFRGYDRPLPLSMGEVILDAVWSVADPAVIRFGLGNLDRLLVPASDPLLRFQRITLNATDGFLLSRVDGASTAAQILRMAPVSREEAMRSLLGLVCTGMVEWPREETTPPPAHGPVRQEILDAYERLREQSHYEVLGVSPGASPSQIQVAFIRLAKFYHPDAHHTPDLVDLKDKLQALFGRVTEAHRALTQGAHRTLKAAQEVRPAPTVGPAPVAPPAPTAPPPAPPSAQPVQATKTVEELLEQASESLAAGRYWETLVAADQALPAASGRLRGRARILKARALLKSEGGRRAAEEELKAALRDERGNADAHFLLGTIYQMGGASVMAAASFKRALDLKPRHAEALQALASLEPGDTGKSKPSGLLGFFKRS
jgi:tetratricopeptide (TPR) repeat protein